MTVARYRALAAGDPAPWFRQRSLARASYNFDSSAGRYNVLCFLASTADPHGKAAIDAAMARPDLFDDDSISFYGVTHDPQDMQQNRIAERYPGYRWLIDLDVKVARLYGAAPADEDTAAGPGATAGGARQVAVRRLWVVLDPTLRILAVVPFAPDRSDIAEVIGLLERLPPPASHAGFEVQAPILVVPRVFESEFCQRLIDIYEAQGGDDSGVMREIDGKTVGVYDYAFKRRRDVTLTDKTVIEQTLGRINRRLVPELLKTYQYKATRIERYIVCCYDAAESAHFAAHRDNTTKGTAHRRFAVSINLNSDFDGGEISFPEYGPRSYKPPVGGAVIFSCTLLHAVSRVTRGKRYAYLPFLYDDAAAALREANLSTFDDDRKNYKATRSPDRA